MKCIVSIQVLLVLLGVCWGQYLNNRPFPTYSLEHMPDTSFTCRAKVLGGYYADAETQCQMFHVCVKVPGLGVQDFRFLCPNGTAFDQESQICAEWDDVDCEAATLYYSSDNFDLYRLGSGFETAPFPGEDEPTFHLQRSETGDSRLSRERESVKINQQVNYNTAPPKRPQYHKERDLLKGSSSSSFFNNKNGGKENDEDYEDSPNRNVDVPQKKITRKINRKPADYVSTTQTQATTVRSTNRQTGFINNFAGSPYVSTTTGRTISTTTAITNEQYTTAINNYRNRQRSRGGDRQYNNADTFRNNGNENGQYRQQSPSTVSYNDGQYNRNQYNQQTESTPQPFRQQYKNVNRQPIQTQETQRIRQNNLSTTSKQNYISKQPQDYSTTSNPYNSNKQVSYKKETENYPTGVSFTKQIYNNQYDIPKTQITQKQTDNYSTTSSFTNKQIYLDKKPTTSKQSDNYPTTYSPNKSFQKQAQYYQKQTENYSTTPETKQASTYDQFNNKQSTFNQNYNNDYRYNQYPSTEKSTTVHTQYTPTVPKQTTQYTYTTTPTTRFSKSFDDTHYDDGTYNPKYDDEKYKPEEEFLKTAHSQNFASSRNELSQSQKVNIPIPTKEPPRPFSATTSTPTKLTSSFKVQAPTKINYAKFAQTKTIEEKPVTTTTATKKQKDASYDYAYYDTNVGSEPDYDIGTEFAKSTKKE